MCSFQEFAERIEFVVARRRGLFFMYLSFLFLPESKIVFGQPIVGISVSLERRVVLPFL